MNERPHERLLSRLTLEQKVAQLAGMHISELIVQPQPGAPLKIALDVDRIPQRRPDGVGHLSMAWMLGGDRDSIGRHLDEVQAAVREHSPFGIGAIIHFEALSGLVHRAGPQYPTAWAQAAMWAPDLVEQGADITGRIIDRIGGQLALSPVMDIARDARWGRVHETFGEDTELVSRNAVAFVRGLQRNGTVLATGKHFVGYGASEGGLNQAITQLGRRALTDEYAEPFRRAIREAGLAVVMNSYSEIDGVPATANRWLLTDLLRGQLGFDGIVVSDYDSITMLETVFHTAGTPGEAARQAIEAGLDVELPRHTYFDALADEVREGRLDERVVDQAVERVLAIKARVGLVPGFTSATRGSAVEDTVDDVAAEHALGRRMAERAIVLLENNGILPLKSSAAKVVVVGPAADELRIHFGAYSTAADTEMILGSLALRNGEIPGIDPATFIFTDIFQARMPGIEEKFETSTRSMYPDSPTILDALRGRGLDVRFERIGSFETPDIDLTASVVAQAVEGADVVIAALGERSGWVGNNTAGEGQTTAEPRLPGDQELLVSLVRQVGVPLVSVVVSGRPLLLGSVASASDALVLAPLLGQHAGDSVADVLVGTVNPSGKLPTTFPRSAGQIPMYHGHHYGSGYDHPTGKVHGYNDQRDQSPLFAFGHGLSYTDFDVNMVDASATGDELTSVVRVTNSGQREGETVVQLYARVEQARVVRPVRQLIDFARVRLASGETKELKFSAPLERLSYTDVDGRPTRPLGTIALLAGLAADTLVTGKAVLISEIEAS